MFRYTNIALIVLTVFQTNNFSYAQELREGDALQFVELADTSNEKTSARAGASNAPSLRPGPGVAVGDKIYIARIEILGAEVLPTDELGQSVSSFERRLLGKSDLQSIADTITQRYVSEGYMLSRAIIHPQQFDGGVLKVSVEEGYLAVVTINGEPNHPLTSRFKSALEERPLRKKTYDRALMLVRSSPGYSLKDRRIRQHGEERGRYAVELVVEQKPLQAQLSVTNRGVRQGEKWRALASVSANSLFKGGDRLTVGYLTKPAKPGELKYFLGRYEIPIGQSGFVGFASGVVSESKPRSALQSRNLDGDLRGGGMGLTYPIVLSPKERLSTTLEFSLVNSRENEDLQMLYSDRLRLVRASGTYDRLFQGSSRARASLALTQGIDIFNATDTPGVSNSRPDADAQFFKAEGEMSFQTFLTEKFSLTGSFTGQYANDPLLFTEEFSLGGGLYGRGYDFGEILGDMGLAGYVEAGVHGENLALIDKWELYSYADAGAVWNEGAGLSVDGNPLYSAGGGLRLAIGEHLRIGYEAAKPLTDAPYTDQDGPVRHRVQFSIVN